jgi:hypothetical protein
MIVWVAFEENNEGRGAKLTKMKTSLFNIKSLLRSSLPAYTDIVGSFAINGDWK